MLRVAPDLERIAARLTAADLRAVDDDDDDMFAARSNPAFVDVYTEAGLLRALHEYGVVSDLKARGLGDFEVRITRDDGFRHRLVLTLPDGSCVMDLRVHLQERPLVEGLEVAVVVIDWLTMQNPRLSFSPDRPRLPGQEHPGTGMGRKVQELLVLLCRRLGRDALVSVPERFHLAVLYRKIGFVAVNAADSAGVEAALHAGVASGLTLTQLAWAVERGFVLDATGARWAYTPHTLVCPVSGRLQRAARAMSSSGGARGAAGLTLHIDLDGLRASLRNDPVDGVEMIR